MMQSRRMDPLLQRAQAHQDTAAKDLAERQRALALHESRLEELRGYAEEYANSQIAATRPADLANRRAFLERIDQALNQQKQSVDHSRASVDVQRERLLLASRDKQVLEQLAASYRAQEHKVVERRGQREMDEIGARRVSQAAAAAETGDA